MANAVSDAIRYPFANLKRLFNYYWIFTIIGILALLGYYIKIMQLIILKKNKDKELPEFGKFWENTKKGLPLFFIIFTLTLAMIALRLIARQIPVFGFVLVFASFYLGFIMPILIIQYALSENFSAGFDIGAASHLIFNNFWAYIVTLFRILIVSLIYLLASLLVVTLIFTIPANKFSQYYLFSQFYKNAQKKK